MNALRRRRHRADGIVESQRPIQHTAGDLPTLGHFTKRGGIQSGLHLGRYGFHRRQNGNLGCFYANRLRQLDGVANDIRLRFQIGRDIHRRIQYKGMADAAFSA